MSLSKGNRFAPLQATANQKTMTSGLARESSGSRKYYADTNYSGAAPPASALPIPKFCQRPSILAKRDTVAGIPSETRMEKLVGAGLEANTQNTISHNQDALYFISQQQSSAISETIAQTTVYNSLQKIGSELQERWRAKVRPKRYPKITNNWKTYPSSRSLQPTPIQIRQVRDLVFQKIYGIPWGQVQAPFEQDHQRQALLSPKEWSFEDTSKHYFQRPEIVQSLDWEDCSMIQAQNQIQQIEAQLTLLRMRLNQNLIAQRSSQPASMPAASRNRNRKVKDHSASLNCANYDGYPYGDERTLHWYTFEGDRHQEKERVGAWDEGYISA